MVNEKVYPEKLDLALKQGETIKVSINIPPKNTKSNSSATKSNLLTEHPLPGLKGSIPAPPTPKMARIKINTSPDTPPPRASSKWKVLKQKLLKQKVCGSKYEQV